MTDATECAALVDARNAALAECERLRERDAVRAKQWIDCYLRADRAELAAKSARAELAAWHEAHRAHASADGATLRRRLVHVEFRGKMLAARLKATRAELTVVNSRTAEERTARMRRAARIEAECERLRAELAEYQAAADSANATYEAVLELTENPSEPTPAMIALMASVRERDGADPSIYYCQSCGRNGGSCCGAIGSALAERDVLARIVRACGVVDSYPCAETDAALQLAEDWCVAHPVEAPK